MQQQQIIEWRRAKVMELLSKGEGNQSQIASILQVDKSIISRDIQYRAIFLRGYKLGLLIDIELLKSYRTSKPLHCL